MSESWTAVDTMVPAQPVIENLDRAALETMRDAAAEIAECSRVLDKGGSNIVRELLQTADDFFEFDHYPDGDVYDAETESQYYYHAHRGLPGEHGHFHTFVRQGAMPPGCAPVPYDGEVEWPTGDDAHAHIVAVSMDRYGHPLGLFATNRWVTGECWYPAADTLAAASAFDIDHAVPSWPTNRWLGAMLRLFRPQVEALLAHRDQVVAAWDAAHPGEDVFEDRNLEMTGWLRVSVRAQIEAVERALTQ